jgi:hypothetical protein
MKRAMLANIADVGGIEAILDRVANGETMRAISLDLKCSRDMLCEWFTGDVERRAAYHSAQARAASALAEESLALADAAGTEFEVTKSKVQIGVRQWIAGKYNPAMWGEKQAAVNVNIGSLHLDSLRRANAMDPEGPVLELSARNETT